jgi:hypothetical protein
VPAVSVSPVSSVAEALDRWRAGDRAQVLRSEFLDVLALVPDPRDRRGRRYPLAALLAIAILATAAGMRGYAGFATWARTAPEDVLARLGIRFRRPSEKTCRTVLSRLDAADLDARLGAYFRERVLTATGQRSVEVVYAICSLPFEHARPAMIATWLRQHWGIENSVHWIRDVTFDEDRCTARTGAGPQVLASLRNTAMGVRHECR